VGAARFLAGLIRRTDPRRLTVIGNTGDDEEFFGLHVAPDLDTVVYTLAGLAPRRRGWGLAGDTFACLGALGGLGLPTWFRLGDRDLATHLARTAWLRAGWPLSRVTAALARAHGVRARVLPMTDDRVRTFVHTDRGRLPFQEYLVRRRARGRVTRVEVAGARRARPAPGVLAALAASDALVIAPSNPLVSIGPILAVPGIRRALARRQAPAAAVSPLVGGRAVRGPLHRMLRGLGLEASPTGIARLYQGLVDLLVLDHVDRAWAPRVARGAHPGDRHAHALAGARRAPCRHRAAWARHRRMTVAVIPIPGLPMIRPGDDLAALLGDAMDAARVGVKAGDTLTVCQKVVSKAEGAIVRLDEIVASPFAERLAAATEGGKDARAVEVVLREAKRIVRMDRGHVICETPHGWVCANAGVDESNGVAEGVLTLLPRDADASAAALCERLRQRFGVELAVVVTDTFGRPWREGLVEVAIGCAGMDPLLDLRGRADLAGRTLHHTVVALADEIAAAAGLVMEKDSAVAAAIVRGVRYAPGPGGAAARLVRRAEFDLFR